MRNEHKQTLHYFLTWVIISGVTGPLAALLVRFTKYLFRLTGSWMAQGSIPLPVWAVIGAVVGATITLIDHRARGEGLPSYIISVRDHAGFLPVKTTIVKAFSAWPVLMTGGVGGIIGPMGRVLAGFTSWVTHLISPGKGERRPRRTAAICGVAAVFGAVFGSPIGGGIFAVEIIRKQEMSYRDLFPAILSSTLAVLTADAMGMTRAFGVIDSAVPPPLTLLPAIILAALAASLFGRGFELFYEGVSKVFRRDTTRFIVPRALLATSLAVIPVWLLHPGLLGSGYSMMRDLLVDPALVFGSGRTGLALVGLCMVFAMAKGAANGLTVGGGLSAGFIMPLASSGMLIGTGIAVLLGVTGSDSGIHALQAAGLAGVLASAMNVPVAAAVAVTEVFGPQMGYPAALAAIMGFQISRHHTVYDVILDDEPVSADSS